MKKAIIVSFLFISGFTNAQLAVVDPQNTAIIANQAAQITQAVQALRQAQQTYQTLQAEGQQLEYMKNYMQEAEQNLKNIGDIKNLKLNQIETVLDQVLCLKGANRFPISLRFLSIVNLIMGAYGKCDNTDVFAMTWGGITKNFNDQIGAEGKNITQFVNQFTTRDQMVSQKSQMNTNMESAYNMQLVGNSYNEETNMALAMKYKTLSDDLMKTSHELSQSLNLEGNDAVQMTKGERLQLMAKAMDYQLKSVEYEEKYAACLKKATELSPNDQAVMAQYQRAMGIREMVMFAQ